MVGDSFKSKCVKVNWIKSSDNKFLILNQEQELQGKNLSIDEQESHPGEAQSPVFVGSRSRASFNVRAFITEHKFNVHLYNNSDMMGRRGVILYANQGCKKVVVSCKNELEIQPVEMVSRRGGGEGDRRGGGWREGERGGGGR